MSSLNSSISNCGYCKHFIPLGQRGGTCGLLNHALVKSHWKACCFSKPIFNTSTREKSSSYALLNR